MARRRSRERARRSSIAGGEELARVGRSGATVHQIRNREYREKEENEADSFPSSARPEEDPRRAFRDGAMDDTLGAREQGPRGHETEREKLGEKEGE